VKTWNVTVFSVDFYRKQAWAESESQESLGNTTDLISATWQLQHLRVKRVRAIAVYVL
jgi:hypothetical protein